MKIPLYETGPARGTYGFPWPMHRTLAEIDAGVGPDVLDVATYRGGKLMGARMVKSKAPKPEGEP